VQAAGARARARVLPRGPILCFARLLGLAGFFAICANFFSSAAIASGNYVIDDVAPYTSSTLGDCHYPLGRARINADGLVTGTWQDSTDYVDRAFVYDTSLITIGYGTGGGINSSGVVTGYMYFDPDEGLIPPGAFRYSAGTITNLGFPSPDADYPYSVGKDINDSGVIAGDASPTNYPPTHAFKWDGEWHDLGVLDDDTYSESRAINSSGTVVGWSGPNWAPAGHAFRYSDSSMTSLPTLGGEWNEANDINDAGAVVGCSDTSDGRQHGFLLRNGQLIDLTPGATRGEALAINKFNEIVGTADGRAFLYIYSQYRSAYFDLTDLVDPAFGWTLTEAHDINARGGNRRDWNPQRCDASVSASSE